MTGKITVQDLLEQVPEFRGKQGLQHPLKALLGLILLSMLIGQTGMFAAHRLGRRLTPSQLRRLGFRPGTASPCHATLTELLRHIDPDAMARVFSQLQVPQDKAREGDPRHLAIDGKTLRASKDSVGKAEHVLSAFSVVLVQLVGNKSSRGSGKEVTDALRLIDKIDLSGKIVTGDANFCKKSITSKIVEKGGDYVFPVKGNQKNLLEEITTAFDKPVFPPEGIRGTAPRRTQSHRPAPL